MIDALMRLLTFFLDGESFCEQIRKTDRTAYLRSGDAANRLSPQLIHSYSRHNNI
jgi:hypothetical protein